MLYTGRPNSLMRIEMISSVKLRAKVINLLIQYPFEICNVF